MAEAEKKRKARRPGYRRRIAPGKHEIRVTLKNGKGKPPTRYVEIFYGSAQQAEARIAQLKQLHRDHKPLRLEHDTFADFVEEWLTMKRATVGETSVIAYNKVVKQYLLPAFGKQGLTALTAEAIQAWLAEFAAAGYAISTQRYLDVLLRDLFNVQVRGQAS